MGDVMDLTAEEATTLLNAIAEGRVPIADEHSRRMIRYVFQRAAKQGASTSALDDFIQEVSPVRMDGGAMDLRGWIGALTAKNVETLRASGLDIVAAYGLLVNELVKAGLPSDQMCVALVAAAVVCKMAYVARMVQPPPQE